VAPQRARSTPRPSTQSCASVTLRRALPSRRCSPARALAPLQVQVDRRTRRFTLTPQVPAQVAEAAKLVENIYRAVSVQHACPSPAPPPPRRRPPNCMPESTWALLSNRRGCSHDMTASCEVR
jgi:hypothetical protein